MKPVEVYIIPVNRQENIRNTGLESMLVRLYVKATRFLFAGFTFNEL